MDKDTIIYLITVLGGFATLAVILERRDKKNSDDSEWKGIVNTKLDQVISSTNDLPGISKQIVEVVESAKSAHKRIDRLEEKFEKGP